MKHILADGMLTLYLVGKIDTETSMKLDPEVNAKIKGYQPQKVCFDLQGVDYVASAFLRICVTTSKQVGDSNFFIVNTQPAIKKIFKIAGLEQVLNIS